MMLGCTTSSSHACVHVLCSLAHNTDPPRPFDFLIDGELVRKTLEQHLLDHNISAVSDGCSHSVLHNTAYTHSIMACQCACPLFTLITGCRLLLLLY